MILNILPTIVFILILISGIILVALYIFFLRKIMKKRNSGKANKDAKF